MFCKHEWKIIKEEKLKSPLELLSEHSMTFEVHGMDRMIKMTKYVDLTIATCTKCGKLKRFETYNHPY